MGKHDQQAEKDEQWLGEELLAETETHDQNHGGKHRRSDSSAGSKD